MRKKKQKKMERRKWKRTIRKLKKLERELFPVHMQEMQDINTWEDMCEFCEGKPKFIIKESGYVVYTSNEIVNFAFKNPHDAACSTLILCKIFKGKIINVDLRESTSLPLVNAFVKHGRIEIISIDKWDWDGTTMYKCKLKFK